MKTFALTFAFLCMTGTVFLHAQTLDLNKKQLKAKRTTADIKVDGILDEEHWIDVP